MVDLARIAREGLAGPGRDPELRMVTVKTTSHQFVIVPDSKFFFVTVVSAGGGQKHGETMATIQ